MSRILLVAGILVLAVSSAVAQNGWTPDKRISGTNWYYSENHRTGKLDQCQIEGMFRTANEASIAHITVAVLSKGTVVVSIKDRQLHYRIDFDKGWLDGYEFSNVILRGNNFAAGARGLMQWGGLFLIWPYDDQLVNLQRGLAQSEDFAVFVEGTTGLVFNTPRLPIAWRTLEECKLMKNAN